MLLPTVEVTLDPSGYVLKVRNLPLPRPDNGFRMRVAAQR